MTCLIWRITFLYIYVCTFYLLERTDIPCPPPTDVYYTASNKQHSIIALWSLIWDSGTKPFENPSKSSLTLLCK